MTDRLDQAGIDRALDQRTIAEPRARVMEDRAAEGAIWDALRGGLVSRAVALVADLRVAQALADGPRRVAELAQQTSTDGDTLQRLLRALASDDIFAEEAPG